MAELLLGLLRELGPLTNKELAEYAREAAEGRPALFSWNVYPHMVRLEAEGRVVRVQLVAGGKILWALDPAEVPSATDA